MVKRADEGISVNLSAIFKAGYFGEKCCGPSLPLHVLMNWVLNVKECKLIK